MPTFSSFRSCFIFVVAVTVLVGCGDSSTPTSKVSGTVTLNGKPPNVKVLLSFVGTDNVPRSIESDDAGKFTVNLPTGEVTATVTEVKTITPAGRSKEKGSEGRDKTQKKEIPAAYSDASKPLLRYTLTPGDNTITVEIKSPPPK